MNAQSFHGFCALVVMIWGSAVNVAAAQSYPAKPIRLVLSGPVGGGADTIARPFAQKLGELLGQQVIVDNRPGAGGILASTAVSVASADGYTLLFTTASSFNIAPFLAKKPHYDPVGDFSSITLVALAPLMVAVHPSLPVRSVKDLIALARSRPGQLLYASNGKGSLSHLATEMFSRAASVDMLHVPYKGGAAGVLDTVSGQVQLTITAMPTLLTQVKANRLRALAVTSPKRSPILPQLPTVMESGLPDYQVVQWYGLFAPKGTTAAVIAAVYEQSVKAADAPGLKGPLSQEGAELTVTGPKFLDVYLRANITKWQKVIRDAKIVLE